MRDGYSVTVSKWGEPILTIEPNMLSGAEHSPEDIDAIRDAGQHLCGFVGPSAAIPTCVICLDDPDCCICVNSEG